MLTYDISQEVKSAAEEAVKEQTTREKQVVSLEERRKHTNTKAKKLKKSLQDDEHAQTEAQRTIKECASKMEKKRAEIEELEASLKKEEDVLEGIRDSLKGAFCSPLLSGMTVIPHFYDRQDASIPRSNRSQTERAGALDRQDQCKTSCR